MTKVETGGHLAHGDHKAIKFKISVDRRKSASETSALDMRRVDFRLLRELLRSAAPAGSLQIYGAWWDSSKNPQRAADIIAKPLSMIFELSWESREVPADTKLAKVVLIFKRCKKEDPGNYRPVSLTSASGKDMEKITLGGIEKHLKDNAVIGHSQHGFMRGKF
ncbi:hypothetical protein BTVI_20301 [Pitangus sulphuratus]|nr:hypothetical protein BTVI_20301 [Pitangus sulphuratus]